MQAENDKFARGFVMANGDIVIAILTVDQESPMASLEVFHDALSLEMRPSPDGQMTIGFRPYIPFAKGDIVVNMQTVQSVFELDEKLLSGYTATVERMKSKIVVPEEKKIILG